MLKQILAIAILAPLVGCSASSKDATPLRNAHAHNDYEHSRPLFDALDNGFCSIEADIHLVDGQLLVAHDRAQATPGRTLESLYLDPLRKRIASHGGRVYHDGPTVILLVDFKSNWQETYPKLRQLLAGYSDMLTRWENGQRHEGAVTVVLTGDHPPPQVVSAEAVRYVLVDGKLPDIESDVPPEILPQISLPWASLFRWRGVGPMDEEERTKLRELVDRVHHAGRTIRLWGAPDQPTAWRELLDANVDWINTDDLAGLRRFLLSAATIRPCTRTAPRGSPPGPGSK